MTGDLHRLIVAFLRTIFLILFGGAAIAASAWAIAQFSLSGRCAFFAIPLLLLALAA